MWVGDTWTRAYGGAAGLTRVSLGQHERLEDIREGDDSLHYLLFVHHDQPVHLGGKRERHDRRQRSGQRREHSEAGTAPLTRTDHLGLHEPVDDGLQGLVPVARQHPFKVLRAMLQGLGHRHVQVVVRLLGRQVLRERKAFRSETSSCHHPHPPRPPPTRGPYNHVEFRVDVHHAACRAEAALEGECGGNRVRKERG